MVIVKRIKKFLLAVLVFAGLVEGGDLFPCYKPVGDSCVVMDYAGARILPMDGEFALVGNKVECFIAKGNAYVMIQSNAPEQYYDSLLWNSKSRCRDLAHNCGNRGKDVEVPFYTEQAGIWYHSCKDTEATPNGCKPVEKGMEFLVNGKLKVERFSREALFYYFEANKRKSMDSLMTWVLKNPKSEDFYQTFPDELESEDVIKAGNVAAPKITEIDFYLWSEKLESKTYKSGKFSSFADVMKTCKAWGAKHHEAP